MFTLRTILIALVLAAWLPSASHCLMGGVLPTQHECCGGESQAAPALPSDCDTCADLNLGIPSSSLLSAAVDSPVFEEDAWLTRAMLARLAEPAAPSLEPPPDSSVSRPPLWMLVVRTALPVRGPSVIA